VYAGALVRESALSRVWVISVQTGSVRTGVSVAGFPRFPCSFLARQARRGMRGRCRAVSSAIGAAGAVVAFRVEAGGVWGNLEPGPWFSEGGGGSGFPQCVSVLVFPVACLLAEQRCSVPDLSLLLFEGLRSGTRRRRGASTSVQAAGETGTETRRAAPAPSGEALCGQYAVTVWAKFDALAIFDGIE